MSTVTKKEQRYYRTMYRVEPAEGLPQGYYHVRKYVDGKEEDCYTVEVRPAKGVSNRLSLWCDCPGYTRQHAPKIQHKHVQLVLDYQRRNIRGVGLYRIRDGAPMFQGSM